MTIVYPHSPTGDWLNCGSESPAEVALNAGIPWDIEVRSDVSRLLADLRRLRLGSLSFDGGASRLEVDLPAPSGTVSVVILGGASNVSIDKQPGARGRGSGTSA